MSVRNIQRLPSPLFPDALNVLPYDTAEVISASVYLEYLSLLAAKHLAQRKTHSDLSNAYNKKKTG